MGPEQGRLLKYPATEIASDLMEVVLQLLALSKLSVLVERSISSVKWLRSKTWLLTIRSIRSKRLLCCQGELIASNGQMIGETGSTVIQTR